MQRAQLLRKLVLDSRYVIDEELVAAAILMRAATREVVAEAMFLNEISRTQVRSFRPSTHVSSFRSRALRRSLDGPARGMRRRHV